LKNKTEKNKTRVRPARLAFSCVFIIISCFCLYGPVSAFELKDIPANECVARMPIDLKICLMDNVRTAEIKVLKGFKLNIYSAKNIVKKTMSGNGLLLRITGVKKSVPAKIEYYPVLSTFPYAAVLNPEKNEAALSKLSEMEKATGRLKFFTYGCTFEKKGSALKIDTRSVFACAAPKDSEDAARKFCDRMREENKISAFVHPVLRAKASCVISASLSYKDAKGRERAENIETSGKIEIVQDYEVHIAKMEFGRGDSWHNFKTARYGGGIVISTDNSGLVQIINVTGLEDMLKICVPSEIEPGSPYQSICAQAIAARSEIFTKYRGRHTDTDYDFCAGTHCQAYGGLASRTSSAIAAVDETSGRIIVSNGHIVDTVYHANCGGVTEDSNRIWSAPYDPSLVKISDTLEKTNYDFSTDEAGLRDFMKNPPATYCSVAGACNNPDKFRWARSFTQQEIDKLIEKQFKIGGLKEIKILERGKSGRITALALIGNSTTERVYKELPIRKLFGMLRSALFVVDVSGSEGQRKYTFRGAGWGHGVGLCQDGAKGMGLSGKNCEEILSHYFSDAKIIKME